MKKWLNVKEKSNNVLLLAILFSLGVGAIFEFVDPITVLYYCITGEDGYVWSEEVPYIVEMLIWVLGMLVTALLTVLAANKSRMWMLLTVVLLAGGTIYSVNTVFFNCLILAVVWFWSEKRDVQLDTNKLLTVGIVLAIISFLNVVAVALYGLSAGLEWFLLNLSLQLFFFIIKPEIVVMIYLFKNSKKKELGYKKVRTVTMVYWVLWIILIAIMLCANMTDSGVISGWLGDFVGADIEAGDWSEWETEETLTYGTDEAGNVTFEMKAEDANIQYDENGNGSTYQTFEFD